MQIIAIAAIQLVLLLIPPVHAQITIQRSDIDSRIGQSFEFASYTASEGQNVAIQALIDIDGAGRTWDFTSLSFPTTPDSSGGQEVIALPAELPGAADPRVANATYAVRSILSSGKRATSEYVGYFSVSETELLGYGTYGTIDGETLDQLYNEALLLLPLPLQFGSIWEGHTTYSQSAQGFTADVDHALAGNTDGWGTLVTPAGSAPVLRSKVVVTLTFTVPGLPEFQTTATNYEFESNGEVFASISEVESFGFTTVIATYGTTSATGSTQPPQTPPTNLLPLDGATVQTTTTLSWAQVADATAYDLQVSDEPSFGKTASTATLVVDETGLTETQYEVSGLENSTAYYWRSRGTNSIGGGPWSPTSMFTTASGVAIEGLGDLPATFSLDQNYPNPFNPATTISFALPEASDIELSVFDILGKQVGTVATGRWAVGNHAVVFDARDLPSGPYFYRLHTNQFVQTRGMLVLK